MYKLIIADDESAIRNLLNEIIDWNSIGFEVVGLFSDGNEVIDYIKLHPVDCVLCDICMKTVSGIQVAEYIYNNIPKIHVSFISGYQDFKYALDALKYNIENYFLKPVKIDELYQSFKITKKQLDMEKSNVEIIEQWRRDIISNITNGIFSSQNSLENMLKKINVAFLPSDSCAVLEISLSGDINISSEIFANFLKNMAFPNHSAVSVFYVSNDIKTAKYFLVSKEKNCDKLYDAAQNLCRNISDISDIKAEIGTFNYYESMLDIAKNTQNNSKNQTKQMEKLENLFTCIINSGDSAEMQNLLSEIFDIIVAQKTDFLKDYFKNLLNNMEIRVFDTCDNSLYQSTKNDYLTKLDNAVSPFDIYIVISNFCNDLINITKNNDIQKERILFARDYIITHIDEPLGLEQMAEKIYLTPSYFSKLFKKFIGQTYINFIITCKMNKAKSMLINTNMKIYEIGNSIGYPNTRSFTKIFKANCGMTPSEYRYKFEKDI